MLQVYVKRKKVVLISDYFCKDWFYNNVNIVIVIVLYFDGKFV